MQWGRETLWVEVRCGGVKEGPLVIVAVLPYASCANPSHISHSCASYGAWARGPQEAVSLIGTWKCFILMIQVKKQVKILYYCTEKLNSTNANIKASTAPQLSQFLKQQLRLLQSMQTQKKIIYTYGISHCWNRTWLGSIPPVFPQWPVPFLGYHHLGWWRLPATFGTQVEREKPSL